MGSRFSNLLIVSLTVVLVLTACTNVRKRIAWSEYVITLNDPKQIPTQAEIDHFFDIDINQNHPYFQKTFQDNLDIVTQSRLTSGNEIKLLLNGDSNIEKIQLIQEAKVSIYVAVFQIACDKTGNYFIDKLIEAVKRGVDVRVLLSDSVEQWLFTGKCGSKMQRSGVQFKKIPYPSKGHLPRIHDKILVIDGVKAIIGGQNIADWHANSNGHDGNFRDTDVLVQGPAVIDIARRFIKLWLDVKPMDKKLHEQELQLNASESRYVKQKQVGTEHYQSWLHEKTKNGLCRFVSQNPYLSTYNVLDAYRLYAEKAQSRIALQTLFFHPVPKQSQQPLWKPILAFSEKPEAEVWILSNGPGYINADVFGPVVGRAAAYYYLGDTFNSQWGPKVKVFGYRSWIHSKAYFFDGVAVAIGSFNFDETATIHTENTLICMDTQMIHDVKQMFKNDMQYSYRLKNPT